MILKSNVQRIISERNEKQCNVASAMSLSNAAFSQMIAEGDPKLYKFLQLAKVLNVKPMELIEGFQNYV